MTADEKQQAFLEFSARRIASLVECSAASIGVLFRGSVGVLGQLQRRMVGSNSSHEDSIAGGVDRSVS